MGGRGTVGQYRTDAYTSGYNSSTSDNVQVSKAERYKNKTVLNRELNYYERKQKDINYNGAARLTKKEARLVQEVQKGLNTLKSDPLYYFSENKISRIHVEDKHEWYKRNRKAELNGSKSAYDKSKDKLTYLAKDKKGNTVLVLTHSATQQGVKSVNSALKKQGSIVRNVKELAMREQSKLIYSHIKKRNPGIYETIHKGLVKYDKKRPTSKSASSSIRKSRNTTQAFADTYLLERTNRKSSLGKQQRTLVRGSLYWLGDSTKTTPKLKRLKESQVYFGGSYNDFIRKYVNKKRY